MRGYIFVTVTLVYGLESFVNLCIHFEIFRSLKYAGDIAKDGVSAYGGDALPKPVTAVLAYTGHSTYSRDFAPSFITVAANDGIANVNTVEKRVANLRNEGVEVEYKRYETAGHGFGLGTGTDAEGWLDLAVQFWKKHMKK